MFIVASVIYAVWVVMFLHRRKVLDYEMFEVQSSSQNKTYQFITTMQEIKLQNCECRRRHEWEDVQADMFEVQMKSLKMQQTQEAGSIIINEVKNIFITVFAATAVINGEITLGAMLAVQYIVGQLNSPIDQLMSFLYSMQDVKISLDRINEIHQRPDEDDGRRGVVSRVDGGNSIAVRNIGFRYDRHSPKLIIKGVSLQIAPGKVTAIVGASGSGKTTLIKLMLGYYRPETGDILVNGTDLATLNLRQWRQCCGVVMQDGVIF